METITPKLDEFSYGNKKDVIKVKALLAERILLLVQEGVESELQMPEVGRGYLDWVAGIGVRAGDRIFEDLLENGVSSSIFETDNPQIYLKVRKTKGEKFSKESLLILKERPQNH